MIEFPDKKVADVPKLSEVVNDSIKKYDYLLKVGMAIQHLLSNEIASTRRNLEANLIDLSDANEVRSAVGGLDVRGVIDPEIFSQNGRVVKGYLPDSAYELIIIQTLKDVEYTGEIKSFGRK